MKWLCVIVLVVNLLLLAYAGYAYITVPNSDVQRVKAELHEKMERAEARNGGWQFEIDGIRLPTEDHEGEVDLEELLRMQDQDDATVSEEEQQTSAADRPKIRTYDIDYMEEPYARGDAQTQAVEDAKETIRTRPFQ